MLRSQLLRTVTQKYPPPPHVPFCGPRELHLQAHVPRLLRNQPRGRHPETLHLRQSVEQSGGQGRRGYVRTACHAPEPATGAQRVSEDCRPCSGTSLGGTPLEHSTPRQGLSGCPRDIPWGGGNDPGGGGQQRAPTREEAKKQKETALSPLLSPPEGWQPSPHPLRGTALPTPPERYSPPHTP